MGTVLGRSIQHLQPFIKSILRPDDRKVSDFISVSDYYTLWFVKQDWFFFPAHIWKSFNMSRMIECVIQNNNTVWMKHAEQFETILQSKHRSFNHDGPSTDSSVLLSLENKPDISMVLKESIFVQTPSTTKWTFKHCSSPSTKLFFSRFYIFWVPGLLHCVSSV